MGGDRGRTVRHYLPVVVGGVGLALLVGLAPTVESRGVAPDVGPAATTPVFPVGDAPQDPGVAASGVRCGPGVRQVPRSHYAPLCQPAFRGANGAETTPGVTATTITVTSRYAATSAEQALFVQLAPGTFASHAQAIALERATIGLFNRSFDLYGRRVVLKTFAGQGDFLDELSSGGLAGAEADAATARSLGAFADVSDTIFNTQPYDDALAAQHVVSVGGLFASAAHLRAEAPYEYFPGPDCEKTAAGTTALVGRAMAGMPAVFAGSPVLASARRGFALISPGNAAYAACGRAFVTDLARRYGVHLVAWIRYTVSLDAITEAVSEAQDMVTQLERAGVTTVLCGCDPITPLFLAEDARSQGYFPEWLTLDFGDTFSQLVSEASLTEWDHSLSGGVATVPLADQEAVVACRLATGNPSAVPPPSYQYVSEPVRLRAAAAAAVRHPAGSRSGPDTEAVRGRSGLPAAVAARWPVRSLGLRARDRGPSGGLPGPAVGRSGGQQSGRPSGHRPAL